MMGTTYQDQTNLSIVLVEWLSDLFVTERTKLSNFDTNSISMYSIRIVLAPKKMACVPRITGALNFFMQKICEF